MVLRPGQVSHNHRSIMTSLRAKARMRFQGWHPVADSVDRAPTDEAIEATTPSTSN
jgi:hypothetical protein